jgi:hypothetical protein
MNVSVTDSLTGYIAIVHADVEAVHRRILLRYLGANHVQQLIDRAALRLEKIEESWRMSFRDDECMEFCYWISTRPETSARDFGKHLHDEGRSTWRGGIIPSQAIRSAPDVPLPTLPEQQFTFLISQAVQSAPKSLNCVCDDLV